MIIECNSRRGMSATKQMKRQWTEDIVWKRNICICKYKKI